MSYDVENSVVNDILCYITTSRDSLTQEDIISSAVAFYDGSAIKIAKELIFQICKERLTTRKPCGSHPNPSVKDMEDILELLEKMENKRFLLPNFLARGHLSLPPASGFAPIAMILGSLRDEISALRLEVSELRKSNMRDAKSHEDVQCVKNDVSDLKKSMSELLQKPNTSKPNSSSNLNSSRKEFPAITPSLQSNLNRKQGVVQKNTASAPQRKNSSRFSENSAGSQTGQTLSYAASLRQKEEKNGGTRTYRNRNIKGTKSIDIGENRKLLGAPMIVDVFVGGCSLDSTKELMEEHCTDYGVDVKNCEPLPTKSMWYKCYKVSVDIGERDKLMNPDLWPVGVYVRKNFKAKSSQSS